MAWPMYRLWLEGKASLPDLDALSLLDVEIANEALDAWDAALDRARRRAEAAAKAGA